MNASAPAGPIKSESVASELSSRLAVLSFAAGLIFCCPLTGLLAVMTGAASLLIGRGQVASSRRFAWMGLLLGMTGTVVPPLTAWGVSGWWEREGRILFSGPNNALYELSQDDIEGFLDEFAFAEEEPGRASVLAFKGALEARHGEFMRSLSDQPPELIGSPPWALDDYVAQFKTSEGRSEVPVSIGLTRTSSDTLRLIWIQFDSESDDPLRFPMMNKESDG